MENLYVQLMLCVNNGRWYLKMSYLVPKTITLIGPEIVNYCDRCKRMGEFAQREPLQELNLALANSHKNLHMLESDESIHANID